MSFSGVRFYPVMGVYQGASGFIADAGLIDKQYEDYVGNNASSYLNPNSEERAYFVGGRKYRMADFYVDGSVRPKRRQQAQNPNWSNYQWNRTDHLRNLLDNSEAVQRGNAKGQLFVAFSATSNEGSVPRWMIDAGLSWRGSGGDHPRMDRTEALEAVTDFYIALIKRYGAESRIAHLVIAEYYPGTGNPLTNNDRDTFNANMKTLWREVLAAAPRDQSGERMTILQANPITSGGQVTAEDIRALSLGITGSDPTMFDAADAQSTNHLQRKLLGDVPLQHQCNAGRFLDGYPVEWDGTPNPWGFGAGTKKPIRYEHMAFYHSSKGPTPYESMLMRDNSQLRSQWHEAWGQFGPNGSLAERWGYLPKAP